jgi:glutamine---fructose-6-phosphate transaminase (isomerizing)
MTHFLRDILRQPEGLRRTIERLGGPSGAGRRRLDAAAAAVRGARHVYLTGIGSSWHAALNVGALFQLGGRPVYMADAAELLQFAALARNAVLIVISRSGRSVEIVQLLAKARESGAKIIGISNAPDGTLAQEAQIPIVIPVEMDHAISVNTYSTLALAAGILATSAVGPLRKNTALQGLQREAQTNVTSEPFVPRDKLKLRQPKLQARTAIEKESSPSSVAARFDAKLAGRLLQAIAETERAIPKWQKRLEQTAWLTPHSSSYFLARGTSLGSAYEARLMWEEGVKSPATAMGTGSFRHGPQEVVANGFRFGMWIDGARMREQDLDVARDLRKLGAKVMLIGHALPEDAGDLVFQLPAIPAEWQFVIDIIPAQLAAERLAGLSGVDPDTFRLCSYVVEDEAGLLPKEGQRRSKRIHRPGSSASLGTS